MFFRIMRIYTGILEDRLKSENLPYNYPTYTTFLSCKTICKKN